MTTITTDQIDSLVKKIYNSLMAGENMGFGEIGECEEEAKRIVLEWMGENDIKEVFTY